MALNTSVLFVLIAVTLMTSVQTLPIDNSEQYTCTYLAIEPPQQFVFNWELRNAKSLLQACTNTIASPTFTIPDMPNELNVELTPIGQNPESLILELKLLSYTSSELRMRGSFSLLTSNDNVIASTSFVYPYGRIELKQRSRVINALHDGDLKIRCKFTVLVKAVPESCPPKEREEVLPNVNDGGLANDFRHLYENPNHTDINILVKNETIPAHKIVLIARSPFFADIFERAENETDVIIIKDMTPTAVRGLVEFLYTDEATNLDQMTLELLHAADTYQLPKLKILAEKAIYSDLNEANAAEILIFAHTYHALKLKQDVLYFIVDHLNGVVKTDGYKKIIDSYPVLLNDIIQIEAGKDNGIIMDHLFSGIH